MSCLCRWMILVRECHGDGGISEVLQEGPFYWATSTGPHVFHRFSPKKIHLSFSNTHGSIENSHFSRPSTPRRRFSYFAGSSWQPKNDKNQLPAFQSNIVWVVLSDEQMSKRWPFPIVNDEQMSISRGWALANCWCPFVQISGVLGARIGCQTLQDAGSDGVYKR